MREDRNVGQPIEPDDVVMTPTEQRLKTRLITLQASTNRLQDQLRTLKVLLALFVLVMGIGGYVLFNVADDARHETLVNRSQGLGNRALLCLATDAPGNDISPQIIAQIKPLCDKDFSGAH